MEGHFGGYAKTSPELLEFMQTVEDQCGVLLDQVYTGKMLFRVMQLIEEGCIPSGSKLLALHTGGLQGRRSVYGPKN
jgi:1-aminocyclopropane-1-carboxylate deaminase